MIITMNKFYYILSASAIYTSRRSMYYKSIWKIGTVLNLSWAMTSNLLLLLMIIDDFIYKSFFKLFYLKILSEDKFNFVLLVFLYLYIPIVIINYFVLFYKDRYMNIIDDYKKYYNKKSITIYLIISLILPIAYILSKVDIRWA